MCSFDDDTDENLFVLDESISRDLIGICRQPHSEGFIFFSIRRGLIYYTDQDVVFRARLICQTSEPKPSNQMDNVFYYGLSFMDALRILEEEEGTKTVLRNVFIGYNEARYDIADFCGIAELEQYPSDLPTCSKEHTGQCMNHQTMYPFCQCKFHAHGCHITSTQLKKCNKIRVIIPFMEPLLRPEVHKVVSTGDALLLKAAFEAWEKGALAGKEINQLNIIHMRVK